MGKKGSYEFHCSRLKCTCSAALNRTMELTAQHLSSYKGQTVFSNSSLTPGYTQREPHNGELRPTSGRYPSGTKITEDETGSNPYCSAAPTGDLQASRVWCGPPAVLQYRGLTVRKKTKKQKEIASTSTNGTSTQIPRLKITNYKDHR